MCAPATAATERVVSGVLGGRAIESAEELASARLGWTEPCEMPHLSYCASVKALLTREDGYGGTFSAASTPSWYMKNTCPPLALLPRL